jgi:hypothetical protein
LKEELEKCQSMKAGELKKELQGLGIATNSFLEKKEFAQALAEARVDGVRVAEKKAADTENYAEYANVEVLTDDSSGPRQSSKQQAPQGGRGSPFGDAAPGGGDMGGMGGMADMLKNMGGMGGGGGDMGGMGGMADMLKNMGGMGGGGGGGMADMLKNMGGMGGGGMGGMGDAMGKAQEMMKNPKVMEMMTKAQSNPKMMKAMQECIANPAAYAKYQNDPEIGAMMNELKKYM